MAHIGVTGCRRQGCTPLRRAPLVLVGVREHERRRFTVGDCVDHGVVCNQYRSVVGFGYALGSLLTAEIGRTVGSVLAFVRFVVLSQRQSRKCSCSQCQQEHLDVPCRRIQKGRLLRPSGSGDVWLYLVVLPEREKYKIEKK